MPALAGSAAIRLGGYRPRYAEVLALAVAGPVAGAVIDTNGDGRWIVFDLYSFHAADGRWQAGTESGAGSFGAGIVADSVAYLYGRAEPGTTHVVEFGGRLYDLLTNDAGWWAAVWPVGGDEDPRAARVIASSDPTLRAMSEQGTASVEHWARLKQELPER